MSPAGNAEHFLANPKKKITTHWELSPEEHHFWLGVFNMGMRSLEIMEFSAFAAASMCFEHG